MYRLLRLTGILAVMAPMLLLSTGIAEAHVLKQDNGYTAVLHIDPDDEPISGEATVLNFYMDNTKGDFIQNNYKITATITANGKLFEKATVAPKGFGNASTGLVPITFPKAAVYNLVLNGASLKNGATQFSMDYLIRVGVGANAAGTTNDGNGNGGQVLLISAASLIVLIMVAAANISGGKRYASVVSSKAPKTVKKSRSGVTVKA